jgi:AcrR family transcriptional regulator
MKRTNRRARSRAPVPASAPAPAPGTRAATKAATRDALVIAAMEAFAHEGLDAPSLDAICARAGLTRGAFYVHFRDRDELVAAVMDRASGWMMDALIARGDASLDLMNTVRLFGEAVAVGGYPRAGQVRLQHVLDACARSSVVRDGRIRVLDQVRDRLTAVTRSGQRAGTIRRDLPPRAVAEVLVAIVLGVEVLLELRFPFDVRADSEALLGALLARRPRARPRR